MFSISIDDDIADQAPCEPTEDPLKQWRRQYQAGQFAAKDLIQHFKASCPLHFTIDESPEYKDLGKFSIGF